MSKQLRRCGERALLIDCDSLAQAMAIAQWLREVGRVDSALLEDVVPAPCSVLLTTVSTASLPALYELARRALSAQPAGMAQQSRVGREVVIAVKYLGQDLSAVAELCGLTVPEFVRCHTAITWRAAFGGFAPGFCYLVDERERLPVIPRRDTPRPHVPAGSVALADRYCGIYPTPSPGGWQLLGRTSTTLWDAERERPALIEPGDRIRFVDDSSAEASP